MESEGRPAILDLTEEVEAVEGDEGTQASSPDWSSHRSSGDMSTKSYKKQSSDNKKGVSKDPVKSSGKKVDPGKKAQTPVKKAEPAKKYSPVIKK